MDVLQVPLILFLVIVAPIWIVAHYTTRWRMAKSLSPEDEKQFAELWQIAERMERSPNAIKHLLARALRQLRAEFGDTQSLHLP